MKDEIGKCLHLRKDNLPSWKTLNTILHAMNIKTIKHNAMLFLSSKLFNNSSNYVRITTVNPCEQQTHYDNLAFTPK